MYKRTFKSQNNNCITGIIYQTMACIIIFSIILILNSIKLQTAQIAIDKIKYVLTYNYDFKQGYRDLKYALPGIKEKVVNTFEQLQGNSKVEIKMILPLGGKIISGFGMRINPVTKKTENHTAIDISAPKGNRVYAAADGTVEQVGTDKEYGKYIKIKHEYNFETLYGSLNSYAKKKGDLVKKGDIIGEVGISAELSEPHLHFEVIKDGKSVNPFDYIPGAGK